VAAALSEISCSDDERRPEISAVTVRSGARKIPSCTERGRDRRPYPAMQIVEATLVARPACSRWSSDLGIPRRSSTSGRRDPVADENVVLVRKKR
jgi:hypothetical protein